MTLKAYRKQITYNCKRFRFGQTESLLHLRLAKFFELGYLFE